MGYSGYKPTDTTLIGDCNMTDLFDWTPVTDYKNENSLNELTAKGWKQYR